MKKYVSMSLIFLATAIFAAEDSYDKIVNELAIKAEGIKKIAIIPFSYADNPSMVRDGSVIAERLTIKFINLKRFEVIERNVLDKVLNELKLQNSGAIDASTAKELGKILGVDAIITGTLVQTSDGKIEINARIIKTETAQAIGASQGYVVKDWVGGEISKPSITPVSQQSYGGNYSNKVVGERSYGFFDVIIGFGNKKIDAKADSFGLPFPGLSGNWSEIKDIKAGGIGPIGFRVGGFGKEILGGDMEISLTKTKASKQNIYFTNGQNLVMPEGYFDVTSFGLSGDLLFRVPGKVQFYFGMGLGFTINHLTSTWLKKYNNSGYVDEYNMGILIRFPVGLRFNSQNTTFFIEYRYENNTFSMDRGNYDNESHSVNTKYSGFLVGLGSRF